MTTIKAEAIKIVDDMVMIMKNPQKQQHWQQQNCGYWKYKKQCYQTSLIKWEKKISFAEKLN